MVGFAQYKTSEKQGYGYDKDREHEFVCEACGMVRPLPLRIGGKSTKVGCYICRNCEAVQERNKNSSYGK